MLETFSDSGYDIIAKSRGGLVDVRKAIIFKQIGAKIAYYRTLSGLHQVVRLA